MIQYRRFALDMQRYADQCLTDDDITAAQVLRGYTNPGDQERNDGFFAARAGQEGQDMSPDGKRLKKHQSAHALATGIWEYEDIPANDDDWNEGDDRRPGEATAASRLGWGAGAKKAVAADMADMTEFEKQRQVRDIFAGNLLDDEGTGAYTAGTLVGADGLELKAGQTRQFTDGVVPKYNAGYKSATAGL